MFPKLYGLGWRLGCVARRRNLFALRMYRIPASNSRFLTGLLVGRLTPRLSVAKGPGNQDRRTVNVVLADSPRCAVPLQGFCKTKWSRRHTLIEVDAHQSFEFGMSSNETVRI